MNLRRYPISEAIKVCSILLCFAMLPAPATAKDLGARGASWPIAESDLLTDIASRASEMSDSGEWARLESEAKTRARRSLEEPKAVDGIVPATARRIRRFDPTITVAEDLVGPDGKIIAAAGTRVNPFAHAPFTSELLFIDGRRKTEVAWALARAESNQKAGAVAGMGNDSKHTKIILLAGRPLALMRRHGVPFYFDLGGKLSARFGVRATPTRAVQDGMHLLLTEFPLQDFPKRHPAAASGPKKLPDTEQLTNRRQPPC